MSEHDEHSKGGAYSAAGKEFVATPATSPTDRGAPQGAGDWPVEPDATGWRRRACPWATGR